MSLAKRTRRIQKLVIYLTSFRILTFKVMMMIMGIVLNISAYLLLSFFLHFFITGLLYSHDIIAQKDYLPKLPDIPPDLDDPEDPEETIKIVQLVKSSEPLVSKVD